MYPVIMAAIEVASQILITQHYFCLPQLVLFTPKDGDSPNGSNDDGCRGNGNGCWVPFLPEVTGHLFDPGQPDDQKDGHTDVNGYQHRTHIEPRPETTATSAKTCTTLCVHYPSVTQPTMAMLFLSPSKMKTR